MDQLLFSRELGRRKGVKRDIVYHESLVRRLTQSSVLQNGAYGSAACWADGSGRSVLVVAGEDCTLRLWDADRSTLIQSFDPVCVTQSGCCLLGALYCLHSQPHTAATQGHTEQVCCVQPLPATGGSVLISAGPSKDVSKGPCGPNSRHDSTAWSPRNPYPTVCLTVISQIRLIDLEKEAVRSYCSHASNINSLLPLSAAMFASGGTDGTIRCHDSRVHARASRSGDSTGRHSLLGGYPKLLSLGF